MVKLSIFFREVCSLNKDSLSAFDEVRNMQRAVCGICGTHFTNKKGVRQHILRIHEGKEKKSMNYIKAKHIM